MSENKRHQPPGATYRLQFNAGFGFAAATAILPYLRELGITDCYVSPLFQAGPQSTHGYDVCGFDRLNPRLGSEADFHLFTTRRKENGLGLLLDMVPNHMGNDVSNEWWLDVLTRGEDSPYARWFDIDWEAGRLADRPHSQVLIPVLEARYAEVLEAGKLQITCANARFALQYYDRKFPLSEATARELIASIPHRPGTPDFERALASFLANLNGTRGQPQSFAQLNRCIRQQHYRLAFWRNASEEINYRRFFDVTELVSMRMELPEVFEATHRLLFSMLDSGAVTGVRVDHPDGLWNPRVYFAQLRDAGIGYIVAEKILTGEETLPEDWPVDGTTGYDFLQRVNALQVDAKNETAIDRIYHQFTATTPGGRAGLAGFCERSAHSGERKLPDMIYACKRLVLERSFQAELNALTRRLLKIFRRDPKPARISAHFVQREEAAEAVEGGVFQSLGHERAGQLLEAEDEIEYIGAHIPGVQAWRKPQQQKRFEEA